MDKAGISSMRAAVSSARIGGNLHASLWSGTAASWVDLNPAGASASELSGISGGHQVGYAVIGGVKHGLVWSGAPDRYMDLNPFLPGSAA